MSLQADIREGIKKAMLERDHVRLNTLRGLSASFVNELVSKGRKPDEELSDDEAQAVISRAVKQRKDSIEQFTKGERMDLAEVEKAELAILESYLPAQMSKEEIEAYVREKLENPTTPEATRGNKNQMIGLIMKDLKGKADGTLVKEAVEKALS